MRIFGTTLLPRVRVIGALLLASAVWGCGGGSGDGPTAPVMEASIPTASVEIGSNIQLSVRNARGTIVWTSSNTAVATVVSTGFVTAVGPGTATITATTPTQSASTLITVPALPAIRFSTASVAFTARVGGADPAPQSVAITDSGGPGLSGLGISNVQYGAGQQAGWLTASLSSATATLSQASTLQLSASVAGLTPGVYNATVLIIANTASNTPRGVNVTFTVGAQPTIELSGTTAQFNAVAGGGNPPGSVIAVTSATSPASGLTAAVSYDQPAQTGWLSATLNTTTTPATLTLQATTGARPQGTYTATVAVASPDAANSPRAITVSLTVAPPPRIDASVTSFSFAGTFAGTNPTAQTSQITNGGGGALTGMVSSVVYTNGNGWLTASLNTSTAPATLTVQPNLTGLAVGTYTATVRISAPGSSNTPRDFPVTVVVGPQSAIAVAPTSIVFFTGGASPAAQQVSITNSGGATLSGLSTAIQYTSGSGWLTATLSSTTAPSTLTLQANTAGLAVGTYVATVNILSPVAGNAPLPVPVTLTISSQPSIVASPNALTFTASVSSPPTQDITITNGGGGTLSGLTANVVFTTGAGWLTANLNTSTAPATVTVQAIRGALAAGTYTANVRITAPGAANTPRDVPVTFTVTTPPTIVAAPTALTFTGSATQTVGITNSGGGTLSGLTTAVQYVSGSGWLSASLNLNSAPATMTVQTNVTGLSPGTYTANIAVSSPVAGNSPLLVPVTLSVPVPTTIALSSTTATFSAGVGGAAPASQTIAITNGGGGTLNGLSQSTSYTSGAGWLTATFNTTTAPATLTLTASQAGLSAGTYTATVNVLSAAATNSPRPITVTFNVLAPSITLSSSVGSLSLASGSGSTAGTVSVTNGGGGTLSGLSVSLVSSNAPAGSVITPTINTTTAPATVTFSATTGTAGAPVTPGTYTFTVRVASALATNSPRDITVTFTVLVSLANNIYSQLYPTYCASCHFGGAGSSVPALNSIAAFRANLINVTGTGSRVNYPQLNSTPIRIVAGNPTQSYIMYQLNKSAGAHPMPTSVMTQVPLALRNLMSTWILQGANNN